MTNEQSKPTLSKGADEAAPKKINKLFIPSEIYIDVNTFSFFQIRSNISRKL